MRSICSGAIRDWNGNVVKRFSGPFDGKDANEVKVFALLIGCRGVAKIGWL